MELLLHGYIRQITQLFNGNVSIDVEQLCYVYFYDEEISLKSLDHVLPLIVTMHDKSKPTHWLGKNEREMYRLRGG